MTPGTQPQQVSNTIMRKEPHPLSTTASGGKKIAKRTLIKDIVIVLNLINSLLFVLESIKVQFYCSLHNVFCRIGLLFYMIYRCFSSVLEISGVCHPFCLVNKKASAPCGADAVFRFKRLLELWTCSNESLTSLIACVLGEVLDETTRQVNCFLLPL